MADQQLATREDHKPKLSDLRVSPGQGIVIETVRDVHNFSVFAAAQGLVPSSFKAGGNWNTGAITIALIKGLELGMKPTQALQSIYVVNNQPSVWGDALPGLVLASGHMEDFRESYEGDGDNLTAVCTVKRRGLRSEFVERFSVADAKKASLWTKTGPWSNYPKRMLKLRARAYAFRAAFADVLKGLAVVEEMQDVEPERVVIEQEEYTSRQDEMLAGLRGGGQEESAEPAPARPPDDEPQDAEWTEPTPEEVEEIRAREMQEAGLFDQEGQ